MPQAAGVLAQPQQRCPLPALLRVLAAALAASVFANGAPCQPQVQELVVDGTAGNTAADLAAAVQCQGGKFLVQWEGVVAVQGTMLIGRGTSVSITGKGGLRKAVADGGNTARLFMLPWKGTLKLEGLTVRNAYAAEADAGGDGGVAQLGPASTLAATGCSFQHNRAGESAWTMVCKLAHRSVT